VIPAIVNQQKTCRLRRVAQHLIGVNHAVKYAACAYPFIERLAFRFVLRRIEAWQASIAAHKTFDPKPLWCDLKLIRQIIGVKIALVGVQVLKIEK
jgi:hypothetical protein